MTWDQIVILIFGVPALWLVGRREPWRRWGFLFGLIAQIGWYYTTIINQQTGILILNILYTYCWIQGIYFGFIKK